VLQRCWSYLLLHGSLLVVLQVLLLEVLLLIELLLLLLLLLLWRCMRRLGHPSLLQLLLHGSIRESQLLMWLKLLLLLP
jgi:hypothetical protein